MRNVIKYSIFVFFFLCFLLQYNTHIPPPHSTTHPHSNLLFSFLFFFLSLFRLKVCSRVCASVYVRGSTKQGMEEKKRYADLSFSPSLEQAPARGLVTHYALLGSINDRCCYEFCRRRRLLISFCNVFLPFCSFSCFQMRTAVRNPFGVQSRRVTTQRAAVVHARHSVEFY